jgi:hypothetical protein
MDPKNDQLERILTLLGEADRDGAFSGGGDRYPWRAAEPEATSLSHRRFAWARVAVPLAAAAAVAVLFVGPSLWSPQVVHEVAENSLDTDGILKPVQPAVPVAVATTREGGDCDYNGDGHVDGKDIQAFVTSLKDVGGDPMLEAEYLRRCLLAD